MNFILFFPDEMRSNVLGCYGSRIAATPNYDRLAAKGTLFENHYVQNPVCVGSRCSLLTGWYPHVKGFRSLLNFIGPDTPNFFRELRAGGYNVQLYGKNHVFDMAAIADSVTCFDPCDNRDPSRSIWSESPEESDLKKLLPHMFADDYTMVFDPMPDDTIEQALDTRIVNRGVSFLDAHQPGDAPFFLMVSINNPHAPYAAFEKYAKMYDAGQFDLLKKELKDQPAFMRMLKQYSHFEDVPESVFRQAAATYMAMAAYCDDMLGRILDAVDRNGLADDTMVLVSSDHGDFAGDYGLVEKWPNAFYDNLTKVPLIMRGPGVAAGHRVPGLVSEIDIMPTVMDYAGIPVGHDQFGHSLRAQLEGDPGDPDAAVYSEGGYDVREPQCFEGTERDYAFLLRESCVYYPKMMIQQKEPECVCRGTMMRKGQYKLIMRTSGDNEFFDLQADPGELVNRYADPAFSEVIRQMQGEMLEWYIATADAVPRLE